MEFLRMKKRRSRKEQEALELWDRYYRDGVPFADEEVIDRLEAELAKRWEAEDANSPKAGKRKVARKTA